jgi:hypothetical protein
MEGKGEERRKTRGEERRKTVRKDHESSTQL